MPTAARIEELTERNAQLSAQVDALTRQLDWFKRQLFGTTSEKQQLIDTSHQGNLLAAPGAPLPVTPAPPLETVNYQRRKKQRDDAVNDSGLRFDDTVPVEVITVSAPDIDDIPEDQREIISEKVTHRLAQRPGSYVILKYVRPVVKRRDTGVIVNTPAPANVLDNSVVDVSFLVGLLIDKFLYHLPLYRQHQRLTQSGIRVARASLTQWCGRAIELLRSIVDAQWQHILLSRVLAMDDKCAGSAFEQRPLAPKG